MNDKLFCLSSVTGCFKGVVGRLTVESICKIHSIAELLPNVIKLFLMFVCFVQSLYFSLYLSSLFRWAVYWQIVTAHLLLSTLCCWLYSLCRCHRRLICANVQINSLWWIFKFLSKLALRKANFEKRKRDNQHSFSSSIPICFAFVFTQLQ